MPTGQVRQEMESAHVKQASLHGTLVTTKDIGMIQLKVEPADANMQIPDCEK